MNAKSRHGQKELTPLRFTADKGGFDENRLERLKGAWRFIAGSGNSSLTHPISVRQGTLVIGCHESHVLKAMRDIAQKMESELSERIYEMLKIRIKRIEIVPSDPMPPPLPASPKRVLLAENDATPFVAVLDYYLRKSKGLDARG